MNFHAFAREHAPSIGLVPIPWLAIARQHTVGHLRRRRILAAFVTSAHILTPGLCCICGCTDRHACTPPCSWTDSTRTLCSACNVPEERIVIVTH